MFDGAEEFNGDVSSWDVSSIPNYNVSSFLTTCYSYQCVFYSIFDFCFYLRVTCLFLFQLFFNGARKFNQDISSWDVSVATRMDVSSLFISCCSNQRIFYNNLLIFLVTPVPFNYFIFSICLKMLEFLKAI